MAEGAVSLISPRAEPVGLCVELTCVRFRTDRNTLLDDPATEYRQPIRRVLPKWPGDILPQPGPLAFRLVTGRRS